MRHVRAKHLLALALGAFTVVVAATPASAASSTSAKLATAKLGPAHTAHTARGASKRVRAHAASGPTVTSALQSLQRSGQITPALYGKYYNAYVAAKRSLGS